MSEIIGEIVHALKWKQIALIAAVSVLVGLLVVLIVTVAG